MKQFDSCFKHESIRIIRMQVRAAHAAKIRVIRGGKKKTHSPTFDKFETIVVTTLVVVLPEKMDWLGGVYGWNDAVCTPRRGNLLVAQGRAKRRPG